MGRRNVSELGRAELLKAYQENEDFREYVDKSKFPDLDTALQNKMVKYYYLYLTDELS